MSSEGVMPIVLKSNFNKLAKKLESGPGACAAGGVHEDAFDGLYVHGQVTITADDGRFMRISTCLCKKCMGVYWRSFCGTPAKLLDPSPEG